MGETTTAQPPIAQGEIVAGKYRVGRVLGQGGMGVVVAATHVQLAQRVALKFLRAEALLNPEVVARFTREAQAAARIQSLHVARVLDVGELPSGAPYMVMEYLEGEDLEQVLRARGPLPIAEAVDLLLEACEAVAEAHMLGIVHRDLKPSNLYLARYPGGRQIIKVLDFGISKLHGPAEMSKLTQAASMFGSPPYMSPEQVRSTRSTDVRSDIWSLGAVLYELLTKTTPFAGENAPAIFAAILTYHPTPPRTLRPEIPPALESAILRSLDKDPARRYQDIAPLAAAIAPFGSARSAEIPARISHLLSMGSTRLPLSATAVAAAAPPPPARPAPTPAGGRPTTPAVPTLLGGQLAPDVPAPVPAPLLATAAAPAPAPPEPQAAAPRPVVAARPPAAPARHGSRAVIAAAVVVALAASGAAYWLGARSRSHAAGGPDAPVAPAPAAPPTPATAVAATTPAAKAPAPQPPPAGEAPAAAAPAAPPSPRRQVVAGVRSRERPTPSGAPAEPPAPACADLLARLSLGETLTEQEAATYARACKKP